MKFNLPFLAIIFCTIIVSVSSAQDVQKKFQLQRIDLASRSSPCLPASLLYDIDRLRKDLESEIDYYMLYDGFVTELTQRFTKNLLVNSINHPSESYRVGAKLAQEYKDPLQGLSESGFMECEFKAFCNCLYQVQPSEELTFWSLYFSKEVQKKFDLAFALARVDSTQIYCKVKGYISPSGHFMGARISDGWYSRIFIVTELTVLDKKEVQSAK